MCQQILLSTIHTSTPSYHSITVARSPLNTPNLLVPLKNAQSEMASMLKRMSVTARQERSRLNEFFISVLVNTTIEIMFPRMPGIPTTVLKILISQYSDNQRRKYFFRQNKIIHSPSGLPPASRSTGFQRTDLSDQSDSLECPVN